MPLLDSGSTKTWLLDIDSRLEAIANRLEAIANRVLSWLSAGSCLVVTRDAAPPKPLWGAAQWSNRWAAQTAWRLGSSQESRN